MKLISDDIDLHIILSHDTIVRFIKDGRLHESLLKLSDIDWAGHL